MRLTYVGHATVLLELGGGRVLTDPVLRRRLAHLRRRGPLPAPVGRLDAVLVSHLHHDHLDPPSGMAALGPLDLALVPVWGWGPTAGEGHLDPEGAAEAVARLQPRVAVPIHWGTLYPVGRQRAMGHLMVDPPHRFAAAVHERAPGVEVRVLDPGETVELEVPGTPSG